MIKLTNLTKYFGDHKVLDDVNLEVKDGSSLAVIGPSGCGKSTLLRLIIRLVYPNSGSILVDNLDVGKLSEDALIGLRQKIGMIFQTSALFDSMNVYGNVAFSLHVNTRWKEDKIKGIVAEKLKMVDLEGTEKLMPSELSGGMQRRVCIARALAFDPKIILYDEPTTGLDPITEVTIENLMIKLSRELKVTSILVTHVLQTVYRVATRVAMLDKGKLIEIGTPEQTKTSKNPVIQKFITGGL
ncbi:MAG: ABC transporter ATP-binding protein [Candidatus Saganbacteria bacterium]|nr:ABC transporter ATP-binding protein [Candidatus Saganbacteria bacterium]